MIRESIYYNSYGELISNIRSLGFKSWRICKDCRLAVTKRAFSKSKGPQADGTETEGIHQVAHISTGRTLAVRGV